jgi:phenylacetate-coenzyme A ligase PaaK-like adenylate-forming protein
MDYPKFISNIALPLSDFFLNTRYGKTKQYWHQIDRYSELDLQKLQDDNLKSLLKHAVLNCELYQNIKLEGDNPYQWLKQFPILTKDIVRNKEVALLTQPTKNLVKFCSSGSSGVQTCVYESKKELEANRALLMHFWEWSGYKVGTPIVQTGITPNRGLLKSLKDIFLRTIYINAFAHSETQILKVLKKIKGKNYTLAGYASSINYMAQVALENNLTTNLRAVISLGDKLFSHYKTNIKKAFNCEIYDTYGSAEGFMIAVQKDLDYYYIFSPHVYLEIVDDAYNPVPDGTMGNILVTRLDGYAMPMIRYRLGDLGIMLPKEKYPKKREFKYPLLQQIVGRETDVVKTQNGKTLVVHSFTGIFEHIPGIRQFKVIQKNLQSIDIEIVKGSTFTEADIDKAVQMLQKYIEDTQFRINFKYVNSIAPSKSGKPQMIESKL